jgi:hypothetical protein
VCDAAQDMEVNYHNKVNIVQKRLDKLNQVCQPTVSCCHETEMTASSTSVLAVQYPYIISARCACTETEHMYMPNPQP